MSRMSYREKSLLSTFNLRTLPGVHSLLKKLKLPKRWAECPATCYTWRAISIVYVAYDFYQPVMLPHLGFQLPIVEAYVAHGSELSAITMKADEVVNQIVSYRLLASTDLPICQVEVTWRRYAPDHDHRNLIAIKFLPAQLFI